MVPSTMAPSSIVAPNVRPPVDLRFAAVRGGAFASIQFQKPSLSLQREGRSSRAVRIAGSFASEISGKCTVTNSSGLPSVFSICGKVGLSARLSASFSHRLLNMNAGPAKTSSRPVTAAKSISSTFRPSDLASFPRLRARLFPDPLNRSKGLFRQGVGERQHSARDLRLAENGDDPGGQSCPIEKDCGWRSARTPHRLCGRRDGSCSEKC